MAIARRNHVACLQAWPALLLDDRARRQMQLAIGVGWGGPLKVRDSDNRGVGALGVLPPHLLFGVHDRVDEFMVLSAIRLTADVD